MKREILYIASRKEIEDMCSNGYMPHCNMSLKSQLDQIEKTINKFGIIFMRKMIGTINVKKWFVHIREE